MYTSMYYHKEVKVSEYSDTLDIQLLDFQRRPDCKIGHFGYNFYFRTNYGQHYKQYKNEASLERAIKLSLKKRGLHFIQFIEK